MANGSPFKVIPIIDLSDIASTDPVVRQKLVGEIKHACMEVGFFYVKNHGIPSEVFEHTLAMMRKFFDLPVEQKLGIENTKTPNFKGYSPILSGNNDPNGAGDLQEGFEFGFEPLEAHQSEAREEGIMAGANIWPTQLPEFRQAALDYYHKALNLGRLLFPLFALALDLPEDFFADKTKDSAALMRLLYYPPQFGEVDDRVIGIGAHTDWECFTILWQQPGIQALQVLNSSKEWIDAPPIEGTLVINLGDELARWTNDVFTSTVHRAINRSGVRRYSIPLFFGTDYDVRLEPIPSCVSPERPAKYEGITAGEYIKGRLSATYGH
ncbi:Clavaminate synthase-like protein [Roridomyces roridus]|uniref:Clavaminate synthase-like protein n=1 Tax=Roridomyces roridus TaxID=1738132 RepID=A0AAD7CC55_9AGAR|nr:Clavaminate synthase-like protein [Roridomyces roridus]